MRRLAPFRLSMNAIGASAVLLCVVACGSNQGTNAQHTSSSQVRPKTWAQLRTEYQPLLTKNGISKGCNYQIDAASCFAGLDTAARSLYGEIAPKPDSASKRDVQGQIDKFTTDYNNYLTKCGPPIGRCTKFEAMTLDVSALGIWRAMVQATD
jgi:hypothetical protein